MAEREPGPIATSFLAETGMRIGEVAEHLGFGAGPLPSGRGWARLDDAMASGLVERMAAGLVQSEGRRDVAGSYLGSRLAGPIVGRTVAGLLVDGRCPDPDPSNVAVHLHDDGWFDAVNFLGPRAAVLADDPAAGQPGTVVVPDPAALRDWWARVVTAAGGPLLEAVRQQLPYGRRGLWGSIADRVGGTALTVARASGRPGEAGWAAATELLDALAAYAPVPLTRPQPFPVSSAMGGDAMFSVKGTCCLYYLTVDSPDPCGEGYFTSCPFTDPDHRHRKLAAWLDEQEMGT